MDMLINLESFAEKSGALLDFCGILVILGGVVVSSALVFVRMFSENSGHNLYQQYRRSLARSILVGLEFLVAGDIIRSVAGDLSLDSVLILAIIVLVRSFLGIEFEMEIDGRWPWKRAAAEKTNKKSS